jgi:hypothetical protein
MATVFEKAPDGYFDREAGRRLREEIYARGGSRDINISIEKFLGRPCSLKPFLKRSGVKDRNHPAGQTHRALLGFSKRASRPSISPAFNQAV